MIADIGTIIWKEMHELLAGAGMGNLRGGRLGLLALLAVIGIFLPLQMGPELVTSPVVMLLWSWVPLFLASAVVADAIAGERERRTLETLLASRISDRAIVLGKVGAAVVYAWGLTLGSVLLSLVTLNVVHGEEGVILYTPTIAAGVLLGSLLASVLVSAVGTLVSLRAATVRQAQQTMSIAIMVLLFGAVYGVQAAPQAWQERLVTLFAGASGDQIVLAFLGFLLVLDALLLAAVLARFRRTQLILD